MLAALMEAEEAGCRLTIEANGEHNEAWVDADDLLAAGNVVSVRAQAMPEWLPPVDGGMGRCCVGLTMKSRAESRRSRRNWSQASWKARRLIRSELRLVRTAGTSGAGEHQGIADQEVN